jgi:hypothetical protein
MSMKTLIIFCKSDRPTYGATWPVLRWLRKLGDILYNRVSVEIWLRMHVNVHCICWEPEPHSDLILRWNSTLIELCSHALSCRVRRFHVLHIEKDLPGAHAVLWKFGQLWQGENNPNDCRNQDEQSCYESNDDLDPRMRRSKDPCEPIYVSRTNLGTSPMN